ncbi:MAG: response regulator transcription factor, partial [bacterium]|nr:response regulator transcription factor [bacterium]
TGSGGIHRIQILKYVSPETVLAILNLRGLQTNPPSQTQNTIYPDFPRSDLSEREREVLVEIAEGSLNKEIAFRLNLSIRTVESHLKNLMNKLNIHSVAGLTKYAIKVGLVSLD